MSSLSLESQLRSDVIYGSAGPWKDFGYSFSTTEHGVISDQIVASKLLKVKSFIVKNLPERLGPPDLTDSKIQELFTEALNCSIRKGIDQTLYERHVWRYVDIALLKPKKEDVFDGSFMEEDESDFILVQESENGEKLLAQWKQDPSLLLQEEKEKRWVGDFRALLSKAKEPGVLKLLGSL
jgi:hypothetical protein